MPWPRFVPAIFSLRGNSSTNRTTVLCHFKTQRNAMLNTMCSSTQHDAGCNDKLEVVTFSLGKRFLWFALTYTRKATSHCFPLSQKEVVTMETGLFLPESSILLWLIQTCNMYIQTQSIPKCFSFLLVEIVQKLVYVKVCFQPNKFTIITSIPTCKPGAAH